MEENSMRAINIFLVVLFICLFALCNSFARIYTWTDEKGVRHYSNTGPPSRSTDLDTVKGTERSRDERPVVYDRPKNSRGNDLQLIISNDYSPKNKIEKARNATVTVYHSQAQGSGFFINKNGYILTNRHVVEPFIRFYGEMLKSVPKDRGKLSYWLNKQYRWLSETDGFLSRIEEYKSSHRRFPGWGSEQEYRKKLSEYCNQLSVYKIVQARHTDTAKSVENLKNRGCQNNPGIRLINGKNLSANLIGVSKVYDLALLKIDGYKCPYIQPKDPTSIPSGSTLYAIGSPLGLTHTITSGVLSGIRTIDGKHSIQTNAQINPGNSGGPLITEDGYVIGINTTKLMAVGIEGIGFAIPINIALSEFKLFLRK
jgi:S1-C subfamily serine protease